MEKTNPHLFYVKGEAPGAPGLKGSRCQDCGHAALLSVPVCPVCLSRRLAPVCIGQGARLRRFSTVFHSADAFEAPYVIGEIETAEGPRTFAPILAPDPARLAAGTPLRFRLLPREGGRVGFAYEASPDTP